MTTIALTGHPVAQDAAALQLQALINGRNLSLRVRIGLTNLIEAHGIREEGGEVWHCGRAEPTAASYAIPIDRYLTADTFDEIGSRVAICVGQMLAKRRVACDPV